MKKSQLKNHSYSSQSITYEYPINDPKSCGTYSSKAPVAPGNRVASVVMPESKVW